MAHLGLLSSIIPYIVLVLSYFTCVGYYTVSKKDLSKDQKVCHVISLEESDQISDSQASFFSEDSTNSFQSECKREHVQKYWNIPHPFTRYVCLNAGKYQNGRAYFIFSRPPPSFV